VIVTNEDDAVSTQTSNMEELVPCSHEEADTQIFVHARHAVRHRSKAIMIKASDTDVLVIAVSVLPSLQQSRLQQLWVSFGQGNNLRWIPVHEFCLVIGLAKTRQILFYHAFTGCDVVSAFHGKGKKSAWLTVDAYTEVSDVFAKLSQYPLTVDDEDLPILLMSVVIMYDRSSRAEGVDDARLDTFARKQRPYETIPPTRGALLRHTKDAAYQAGCIRSQSTVHKPETQDPAEWGWREKRWSVARFLDRPSTYCQELSAIDKVRLQVGVPWKVQVLPLCTCLHCTL